MSPIPACPCQAGDISVHDEMQRFLIKARGNAAPAVLKFCAGTNGGARNIRFHCEPLFESIGATDDALGKWYLVTPPEHGFSPRNSWEICHDLVQENPEVLFAEPDLVQQWPTGMKSQKGRAVALATRVEPEPQDTGEPYEGHTQDNYWFRDKAHGQFDQAIAGMDDPGDGKRVRIAHLDTGFDPAHCSVPRFMLRDLERNFIDPDRLTDATDRSADPWDHFGHGCGTLGILSGGWTPDAGFDSFGCAPFAEIVPIRIADHAVRFSSSAVARGLDWVHRLCRDGNTIHVLCMSIGGIPCRAWVEAVNALYEEGVVVVAAAGNNFFNQPSHLVVYPARFNRVIAACGVMANDEPYANLSPERMAGNYGPDNKLETSIAAYTPNIPWARFGEPAIADFNGTGTSAATPQVAAAAALWIQSYRQAYDEYPRPWMRVEAVRKALFDSAKPASTNAEELGRGRLRAADALGQPPELPVALVETPPDTVDLVLLRQLFPGVGQGSAVGTPSGLDAMLALETLQVAAATGIDMRVDLSSRSSRHRLISEILRCKTISSSLRKAIEAKDTSAGSRRNPLHTPARASGTALIDRFSLEQALKPTMPNPPYRRLRIYAYDPGGQTKPDMFDVSVATVPVLWETKLEPGPVGEYVEVIDIDPASNMCYAPICLDHPAVLAQNGLAPSESDPRFHQQMVYAVAMRTIDCFERALGRRALWAKREIRDKDGEVHRYEYVPRLRIYPHALREANAYYNPEKVALLLGYFRSKLADGTVTAGASVFASTSHDIIAHETTHALLDGIHPRYAEATNMDMPAFHEAFADIVALLQHFSMPESLMRQIRQTAGKPDLAQNLGKLARQFGEATGLHGALRSFVGESGQGITKLSRDIEEPHTRGAILVSAIFAAFLTIYRARSADLIRLATNGSGILPDGDISYDLGARLSAEASRTAEQVLTMCIRALDYCPPVNLEFGDYLRALVTADRDMVDDDHRGYRVAFIDAFRERAIVPRDIRHLAEDSLVWEPPSMTDHQLKEFEKLPEGFNLHWNLNFDRRKAFETSEENRKAMHEWLNHSDRAAIRRILGFREPKGECNVKLPTDPLGRPHPDTLTGEIRPIEVHSVRPSRRNAPDGTSKAFLTIELTQTYRAQPNQERYRGGCTLVFSLADNKLKYTVSKPLFADDSVHTQIASNAFAASRAAQTSQVYYGPSDPRRHANAFAMIHRCSGGH
jgi:subtilisin family serine protease